MMLAANLVGDWLGFAGLAAIGLALPLSLLVWRPVGVVPTDRRLLVSRTTQRGRFRGVLLEAPRRQAAVDGLMDGMMVNWGVTEFVVSVDGGAAHAPIRLIFWGRLAKRHGRAVYVACPIPARNAERAANQAGQPGMRRVAQPGW